MASCSHKRAPLYVPQYVCAPISSFRPRVWKVLPHLPAGLFLRVRDIDATEAMLVLQWCVYDNIRLEVCSGVL